MAQETDGPRTPSLTVLVADPSADNADTLALVLAAVGHRARTAGTAADALALAAAARPDVVIAEAEFPDADAAALAARLAAGPTARPLLILLTGWPMSSETARHAGFDHLVIKPADPEALLALLAAHAR